MNNYMEELMLIFIAISIHWIFWHHVINPFPTGWIWCCITHTFIFNISAQQFLYNNFICMKYLLFKPLCQAYTLHCWFVPIIHLHLQALLSRRTLGIGDVTQIQSIFKLESYRSKADLQKVTCFTNLRI